MSTHREGEPETTVSEAPPRAGGPFMMWTLVGVLVGLVGLVALNMK